MTISLTPYDKLDITDIDTLTKHILANIQGITYYSPTMRTISVSDSIAGMKITQAGSGHTLELVSGTPELRFTESDQTDPAGRWRFRATGNTFILEKELTSGWVTDTNIFTVSATPKLGLNVETGCSLFDVSVLQPLYSADGDELHIQAYRGAALDTMMSVRNRIGVGTSAINAIITFGDISRDANLIGGSHLNIQTRATAAYLLRLQGYNTGTLQYDSMLTVTAGNPPTISIAGSISGVVPYSLFDADTFLYATLDDTPVATSPANVLAALTGHADAAFDWNNQNLTNLNTLVTDAGTPRDLTINTGAEKTVVLTNVVYDDLRTPVQSLKLSGVKPPTWTSYKSGEVLGFSDQAIAGNEEIVFFNLQMPHNYKEGTDISIHVHFVPEDNTGGNVYWMLTYSWATIDLAFAAATTIYVAAACGTTTDAHKIAYFADIDGNPSATNKLISSMLICKLQRNSSDALDTYNGKSAYLLEVDVHYQMDTIGSRTALAK
jgi:hypothetical protein